MWDENWKNAERFFHSKGNITTKSKLKDKWHNEFFRDLDETGAIILREVSQIETSKSEADK